MIRCTNRFLMEDWIIINTGLQKGMKFSSNLIHFSGKRNFCARSSRFPAKDKALTPHSEILKRIKHG